MVASEQQMRARVRSLARVKRLRAATAVVLLAGIGSWGIRGPLSAGSRAPVATQGEERVVAPIEDATMQLEVSDPNPLVGDEVRFIVTVVGGPVVTPPVFDPGEPHDAVPGMAGGPAYPCGASTTPSERTTDVTWTYRHPGEHRATAAVSVLDPCTGEVRFLRDHVTVTVRPAMAAGGESTAGDP